MNPILKNILAIILGWVVGSVVNIGLVQLGHTVFPLEGLNPDDIESVANAMKSAENKHFIFPFLAHALGTLVGAAVAAFIAASHKMKFALAIGVLFLAGGIWVSTLIPAPTWFTVTDLVLAYIPMAWIGGKWASKK